MSDYYKVLGLSKSASADDIKSSFRKLASKYHPDKVTGDDEKKKAEVKFKEVKEAYEILSDVDKRAEYDQYGSVGNNHQQQYSYHDDLFRAFQEMRANAERNRPVNVQIRVSLKDAFEGCEVLIKVKGHSVKYKVQAGLPHGVAFIDHVTIEEKQQPIQVQIIIATNDFRFRQLGTADGINFSGDLELDVSIDAIDIIIGAFITVKDFLNKELQVRVPSGFDPGTRLKVAGYGYKNWNGDKAGKRADLYLRVVPKFVPFKELNPDKVEALYNITRNPPIEKVV